jgi:hypothetical protein
MIDDRRVLSMRLERDCCLKKHAVRWVTATVDEG